MIDEYDFRVWSTLDGLDHASWGGLHVKARRGVVAELARKIAAAGGPSVNLAAPVRLYGENGGKLGGAKTLGALVGEST